jgi:hypothetical protein
MNAAQWLAAILIFNFGLFVGWVKGFNTASKEYFYRGKLAAVREQYRQDAKDWGSK